ncbi:MAG: toprim domain-containing protein [Bacteroidales bacterium]|nr:toprim domain-containing protein [Candidatus Scybalousia scybalohippi]
MENERATQLAKVLWYYNLIPNTTTLSQKIVCPFHNDANPSMLVNFEDGSWYCFGCNEAGDAKRFVQKMESKYNGLNDLQAYKEYLKILKSEKCSGIHINPAEVAKGQKPQKQLYDEAYDYYHGLRTIDWSTDEEDEVVSALAYMEARGFSSETLNKCRAKITYNKMYGLIFPMLDNGKFRGWVCRTMRKDVEQRRKYLYNEGFSRATTLCGNYGTEKYVFVVEGYMDRLKFVHNGVDNVVAVLGWKMSKQQFDKLKAAGVTRVISALDNDECGKKGTRYLKQIFGVDNVVRWQYIKGIKDPGDMSPSKFSKMYGRTMELYQQRFGKIKSKGAKANGRISKQHQE